MADSEAVVVGDGNGYGESFTLTLFTRDPDLAAVADGAGIDRIGVDLEQIGKPVRQGHLPTWISDHQEADLVAIRPMLKQARLFARSNPIHPGSGDEIEGLLARGVQVVMLPFFTSVAEAERFIRLVDGRAHPVLLVETAGAAEVIDDLCRIPGVSEIHVGLNDMRLSLGWPTHFHVLASDFLERICARVRSAGIALAVGGIGRAGDNALPVPADLVYAQMPRLGASGALVSRAFFRGDVPLDLSLEIGKARQKLGEFAGLSQSELALCRERLIQAAERLV